MHAQGECGAEQAWIQHKWCSIGKNKTRLRFDKTIKPGEKWISGFGSPQGWSWACQDHDAAWLKKFDVDTWHNIQLFNQYQEAVGFREENLLINLTDQITCIFSKEQIILDKLRYKNKRLTYKSWKNGTRSFNMDLLSIPYTLRQKSMLALYRSLWVTGAMYNCEQDRQNQHCICQATQVYKTKHMHTHTHTQHKTSSDPKYPTTQGFSTVPSFLSYILLKILRSYIVQVFIVYRVCWSFKAFQLW